MAAFNIAGWWQRALMLTSLFANDSDLAAVNTGALMTPISSTAAQTSVYSQNTFAPSADIGAAPLPNTKGSNAIDAQKVCPGYALDNGQLTNHDSAFHLSLNGKACNVYGTDIHELDFSYELQTETRLRINIRPSQITSHNESWYVLPETWVPAPQSEQSFDQSDLLLEWIEEPYNFAVTRRSTDETLFSTRAGRLVYEDQFIEFVSGMNKGYNLYGLGKVIHGLRLQPGHSRTIFAADNGDPVDGGIYGSHPFALETRYYKVDPITGREELVTDNENNVSAIYISRSHGIYMRNAHAQEIHMGETNITWRMLGGEIDLYFFSGPSQVDVISQYLDAVGLPALQQYWTFGYHQCRWGYENWSVTEKVVDNFAKFEIPLETIWNDIDYMKGHRNFDNDPIRFPYAEGKAFLDRLHSNGQHYVPIVDAAIYHPNPTDESDAYEVFNDGNSTGSFLLNPDGSLYIGAAGLGLLSSPTG